MSLLCQIHEQNFAILLECSEDIMADRLLARGQTSGRADDKSESITKRLHTFRSRNGNQAVEDHLRQKGPFKVVSPPLNMRTLNSAYVTAKFEIQSAGTPDHVYSLVKPAVEDIVRDVESLSGH